MPLSETETFGTVVPGFVTDLDGALVVKGLVPTYGEYVVDFLPGTTMLLPLGDTDGLVDRSTGGHDGTAGGGITVGAFSPGPLARGDEGATDFDGTDDRVTTAGYNPFVNGSSLSVMGWFYRDASATADNMIGTTAVSGALIFRLAAGSQDINFFPISGAAVTWTAAGPGNGVWFHVALTYVQSTGAASLYINGAFVSTQNVTGPPAFGGAGDLAIGVRASSFADPFDGKAAWVSVHNQVLTAEDISNAYTVGTT